MASKKIRFSYDEAKLTRKDDLKGQIGKCLRHKVRFETVPVVHVLAYKNVHLGRKGQYGWHQGREKL